MYGLHVGYTLTSYTRIRDWAVDLQEFQDVLDDGDDEDEDEDDDDIDNAEDENCIQQYANLDALVADINNVAPVCAAGYAVRTMATLLDDTLKKYDEIKNDYDGKFGKDSDVRTTCETYTDFAQATMLAILMSSSTRSWRYVFVWYS
jgi:hypothetical protein